MNRQRKFFLFLPCLLLFEVFDRWTPSSLNIYCIDIAHGNTEEWKGNGKRVERKKTSEWRAAIVGGWVLWKWVCLCVLIRDEYM